MCGRYSITTAPEAIRALFRYKEQPNFPPRFNVAPTQPIPIVRLVDGERHFALVRWGLLPSWVKDPQTFTLLINARGETASDKPAYRAAMKRRRCLIPADGFYEWQKVGERKRPFHVRARSGAPLAFAGLWETWCGPNGEELETAAIVTTTANGTLKPIHDRMPVVVPPDGFDLWLNCAEVDEKTAVALIAPAPDDLLEAFEISTAVNRVVNDDARLIEPVVAGAPEPKPVPKPVSEKPAAKKASARRAKKDDGQGALF
jgi:putative SOS response-associated peptidase YedK